jgi:hypothetical protein
MKTLMPLFQMRFLKAERWTTKNLFPAIRMAKSTDVPGAKLLRQAFDAPWQASGFERSPSYDLNGDWKKLN